jgi:hypothetical protein
VAPSMTVTIPGPGHTWVEQTKFVTYVLLVVEFTAAANVFVAAGRVAVTTCASAGSDAAIRPVARINNRTGREGYMVFLPRT